MKHALLLILILMVLSFCLSTTVSYASDSTLIERPHGPVMGGQFVPTNVWVSCSVDSYNLAVDNRSRNNIKSATAYGYDRE